MSRKTFKSVWDALCDDPVQAKILKGKSEVFRLIMGTILQDRGHLSEAEVLKKYHITKDELVYLLKGNLSKIPLERLLEIVLYAGYNFDFVYKPLVPQGASQENAGPAAG